MIRLKTNMVTIQGYYWLTLMYEIKTKDAYEDLNKNKEMFDFGNY